MPMTDSEIRGLCNRFFDAYQNEWPDQVEKTLSKDCIIWQGPYDREVHRDDLLKALPNSYTKFRRKTYNDRQIDTFDGGFVIRYTLNLTENSGRKSALWVCIVAKCQDGLITRIDEYIDPQKYAGYVKPENR